MTENEAREIFFQILYEGEYPTGSPEAFRIAIKVIKEIQQYRAIGTVEQLEWCKDASHWKSLCEEKLEKYEAIGTIEEFKALKEKNTPLQKIRNGKLKHCPTCKYVVDYGIPEQNYCDRCGQRLEKLDWQ